MFEHSTLPAAFKIVESTINFFSFKTLIFLPVENKLSESCNSKLSITFEKMKKNDKNCEEKKG